MGSNPLTSSRIYAIGDLHLSFANDKPMGIFGKNWEDHSDKIFNAWRSTVCDNDVVLVPGDISWAMTLDEAEPDIKAIAALPGKKILLRGNHDYWWSSLNKVRSRFNKYNNLFFIQNDSVIMNGFAIAGTRGWLCPQNTEFKKADERIYNRELARLELSLQSVPAGYPIIALTHFPPLYETIKDSGFSELLEKYHVSYALYGHLHSQACRMRFEGEHNGVVYSLCSSDFIHFSPKLIIGL